MKTNILNKNSSPYAGLVEAALHARLELARQIDAGRISVEDGQARLAALDAHIRGLPGSTFDILSMTAATNPR